MAGRSELDLKLIGQFDTESQQRLTAQLSEFQNNVVKETTDIRAAFMPELEVLKFVGILGAALTLLPGQAAICDSAVAAVTVPLAAPIGGVPGFSAIIKRQAANNVTAVATGVTSLNTARTVNGAATKVYAAVGLYWVYFDGSNWWA